MMQEDNIKIKVQGWIVSISFIILCTKFLGFYLTNSIAVLTDAMESIVNVAAELFSFFGLRWAAKPRDKEHPFGHGKMEFISASFEAILIILAGGLMSYEAILRFFEPAPLQNVDFGIFIVALGGLVNYMMGWYSVHVGKKHDSMALIAGGKHLQSDTYSSIGLVLGLVLLYFTDNPFIDSAIALIFGIIIIYTGFNILRKTVADLLDKADNELLERVAECIKENRRTDWIDIHNTRISKYGSCLNIDCDLTLPYYYTIDEGHCACNSLEETLAARFSDRLEMCIHSDPCDRQHCEHCNMHDCETRHRPFEKLEDISLSNIIERDEERSKT